MTLRPSVPINHSCGQQDGDHVGSKHEAEQRLGHVSARNCRKSFLPYKKPV
jgi:hypothetical protein